MLPLSKVLEVQRLLEQGDLSCRAISRQTGVGRGTVNAIANGQRGLHGADSEDEPEDPYEPYRSAIAERCPECGGMVYAPCVLCGARRHRLAVDPRPRRAA